MRGRKLFGHMHDVRIFKQSATPGNIIVVADGNGAQPGARAPNGRNIFRRLYRRGSRSAGQRAVPTNITAGWARE